MTKHSRGADLVAKLEAFFLTYMAMSPEYALVAALWALNTWIFQAFDATPYVVITADTKGSGKSTFGEMILMLSRNGKLRTDVTKATMFRLIEAFSGKITIGIDEAEKLRHENHELRPFANTGYRRGGSIPRTVPGPDGPVTRDFDIYCPKLFILIGDVWDTLRDRSIVLRLSRGRGKVIYRRSLAERDAAALIPEIEALWAELGGSQVRLIEADWLTGRDEEIWTPLVSLAHALNLPQAKIDQLVTASTDLTASKGEKARRIEFTDVDAEEKALDDQLARRLLLDLETIIRPGERVIFTQTVLERLRLIPTGPWRMYKGIGLAEMSLSALLSRFGVGPEKVSIEGPRDPAFPKLRNRLDARGYRVAEIRKAIERNADALKGVQA